jgi:Flp pilus assembly protein TadD
MPNRTTRRSITEVGLCMLALAIAVAGCASKEEEEGAVTGALATGEIVPAPAATEGLYASLRDAAVAAERGGDYVSAITFYNSLYRRKPENLKISLGLARNLRYVGAADRAVEVLELALGAHPDEPDLVSELGKVHLSAGAPEKALGSLLKARELSPGDWRIHSALGITYDRLGRYDAARLSYKEALDRSPGNVSVLNNLALSYVQTADLERGIEILSEAISSPRASVQVRQNLALLYALNGDIDEAEKLARRDLPEKMVQKNLEYYRVLTASRRQAGAGRSPAPAAKTSAPPPGTEPVQIGPWEEDTDTEREGASAQGAD